MERKKFLFRSGGPPAPLNTALQSVMAVFSIHSKLVFLRTVILLYIHLLCMGLSQHETFVIMQEWCVGEETPFMRLLSVFAGEHSPGEVRYVKL
jgi:hypothetical protein